LQERFNAIVSRSDLERRGCTLSELLRFYAESYVRLARLLHDLYLALYTDELSKGQTTQEDRRAAIWGLMAAKNMCEEIGLQVCCKHVDELSAKEDSLLAADIKALQENIERELSCHFFVGVPAGRIEAFTKGLKGWENIAKEFPAATEDIEEMSKCFALCRYSAAVFHSLLVAEHGLVRLGQKIGVTDPKEGWDASTRKLAQIVTAGHDKNATALDFAFLEQLSAAVQAMKFAWRNKVNHATGKPLVMGGGFPEYVAEDIISATRNFMRQIAEGLHEEETRIR